MERDVLFLIIGIVAGGFLSVVLGYFVNITTPGVQGKIQAWGNSLAQKRAKQSIERANKRIIKLRNELEQVTKCKENPVVLNALAFSYIFNSIGIIVSFLFIYFLLQIGIENPSLLINKPFLLTEKNIGTVQDAVVLLGIIGLGWYSTQAFNMMVSVSNFNEFREYIVEQIEELRAVTDKGIIDRETNQ